MDKKQLTLEWAAFLIIQFNDETKVNIIMCRT